MKEYLVNVVLNGIYPIEYKSTSRNAKMHLINNLCAGYDGFCIVKELDGTVISECRYDKEIGFYYVQKEKNV